LEKYRADLPITVNLNDVLKYHEGTRSKIDHLQENNLSVETYETTVNVNVIAAPGKNEMHPAYAYFDYIKQVGIIDSLANTLIYIVHAFCRNEWNFYQHSLLTNEIDRDISLANGRTDHNTYYSLIDIARENLDQLRLLCQFIEGDLSHIDITINHKTAKPKNKEAKGYRNLYISENLSIKSLTVVTPMLRTAIDTIFKSLQTSPNTYLTAALNKIKTPTSALIQEAIESLPKQLSQDASLSAFRKLIVQRCLLFLNTETNIQSKVNEVSPDQGEIIYSLLSLFGIIDFDLIDGHADRTSKVKYIRSLVINAGNLKRK
jgi:hypothetical protein